MPWPPFDPANPSAASLTNIPAGYRFVYGVDPPSGPVNQPPVALASSSTNSVHTNQPVSFSSAGSYDPEGVALTYLWSFGDGATSTVANPTHSYSTSGVFSVQLSVSDGVNTASTNLSITVTLVGVNLPPSATATAAPSAGVAPLSVTFSSAGSYDPEGSPLTYQWSFGDGTTSSSANPSKVYQNAGEYIAQLTVSDGSNTSAPSRVTITAGNGASGMVAAYGFEEGSGSQVTDASGHGNTGSLSGTTWVSNGRVGQALSFGSGSMITVNDSASLDSTSGLTLEAWVYPTAAGSSWENLIIKPNGDPGSTSPCYVLQGATPPNQVPSFFISSASSNLVAASALPLNTWSYVAATYDGTTIRLYVNSLMVGSEPQSGAISTSTDALTIGGNTYSGQNWTGLIDEIRIYNRALTSNEIQTDMNSAVVGAVAIPSPPQGLRVLTP